MRQFAPVLAVIVLTGCGHIPDAKLNYFLTRSEVSVRVVRTVACDAADRPVVATVVTPNVKHFASVTEPIEVNLANLKSSFADSDLKFELYEDGRLKAVNGSHTGQGEALLKAVATLSTNLVAFDASTPPTFPEECKFIKESGAGKPVTLTYEGTVDVSKKGPQEVTPDAASIFYDKRLSPAISGICAEVTESGTSGVTPLIPLVETGEKLVARSPGWARLVVRSGNSIKCQSKPVYDGRLAIAQLGEKFSIPIPSPTFFGKVGVAASFEQSGALMLLQYSSTSSAAPFVNAATSAAAVIQGETTAQKVAELKAEADLIAQQQRLVQCQADPKICK